MGYASIGYGLCLLMCFSTYVNSEAISTECPESGDLFLPDKANVCVYYQCSSGSLIGPLTCAPGTAVTPEVESVTNPCIITTAECRTLALHNPVSTNLTHSTNISTSDDKSENSIPDPKEAPPLLAIPESLWQNPIYNPNPPPYYSSWPGSESKSEVAKQSPWTQPAQQPSSWQQPAQPPSQPATWSQPSQPSQSPWQQPSQPQPAQPWSQPSQPYPQPSPATWTQPSPSPAQSPWSQPVPAPAPAPSPWSQPAPAPQPWSQPAPAPVPAPTPWSQPSPSPAPSPWSQPAPSPAPAPAPAPWSQPAPAPAPAPWSQPAPAPAPAPWSQPSPSPASAPWAQPSPSPAPAPWSQPSPSPAPAPWSQPSPSPSPSPAPSPTDDQQAIAQIMAVISMSHIAGGNLIWDVTSVEDCLARCSWDWSCQGFDFNVYDKTCWLHNSTTECNDLITKENVKHYRLTMCTNDETTTTNPATTSGLPVADQIVAIFPDMHILNGSLWEQQTTAEECIEECLENSPGCLGVDFVEDTMECFGHFEGTECNILIVLDGVTHFRLTDLCDEDDDDDDDDETTTTTTTEPTTETTTVQTDSTTGPEQDTIDPMVDVTEIFVNMHIFDGEQLDGFMTAADCVQACVLDDSCLGVDFNEIDNLCFHHFEDTECDDLSELDDTIHYRLTEICSATTETTSTTTVTETTTPSTTETTETTATTATTTTQATTPSVLETFVGFHVFGGTEMPGVDNVASCLSSCTGSCAGVDFNSATMKCFLHFSTTECTTQVPKAQCVHYRIMDICSTSTASTTSTTATTTSTTATTATTTSTTATTTTTATTSAATTAATEAVTASVTVVVG